MAEEIWHHGVKGMKWGVRHTPEQLGHSPKSKQTKTDDSHEDYKKAHDSKSVKKMSDAELRSRLNRLNMERCAGQEDSEHLHQGCRYCRGCLFHCNYPPKQLEYHFRLV